MRDSPDAGRPAVSFTGRPLEDPELPLRSLTPAAYPPRAPARGPVENSENAEPFPDFPTRPYGYCKILSKPAKPPEIRAS